MNPAEIAAATGGTVTERAIAILVATGVTSNRAIAEALGVTMRAVQKARKATQERTTVREPQFAEANHSSPKSEPQFASEAPPPPKRKVSPCTPSKENTPPPQPIPPHFVRSDGRATLEISKTSPEEKNKPLPDLVQAAERAADPDEGEEGRYWAVLDVMAKAGLPRSQLVKLGKLIGEHDEALSVLRTVAAARVPATYLAKIIRNREQEARQESLAMAGLLDEPEFVRGYRREGYSPIYKRPDGNWEISRWTFSPAGEEIGG